MKKAFAFVGILIGCAGASAQEAGMPGISVLACSNICAQSTPAVTTDAGIAQFPYTEGQRAVEGFVSLRYTVGTDGLVKDVTVLHLVGPQIFADNSVAAVKARKFVPATLNGEPVEQSRTMEQVFGKLDSPSPVRESTASGYNRALLLMKKGENDAALDTLFGTQSQPYLNFTERGMLADLSSRLLIAKGDYLSARSVVELPTTHYGDKVTPEVLRNLIRARIAADLGINDVADAVTFAFRLKQMKGEDASDGLFKAVEDARIKAVAAAVSSVQRKIWPLNEAGGDYLPLSRRNFSFTITSGSLDKFDLDCRQKTIESKITASAQWHVPPDWDRCYLLVQGAPGTIYQINETNK